MKILAWVAAIATLVAASLSGAPAVAQTVIDFETWSDGTATAAGNAVGADSYAGYGVHFSGDAWIAQCGGGCPDPVNGHFMMAHGFGGTATMTFDGTIDALDFWVPTNSRGTVSAYNEAGDLVDSVTFDFDFDVDHFALSGLDINKVIFSSDFWYAVDDLSFTLQPQASSPSPEPASWALMLFGFGTVGASLRARRSMRLQSTTR